MPATKLVLTLSLGDARVIGEALTVYDAHLSTLVRNAAANDMDFTRREILKVRKVAEAFK